MLFLTKTQIAQPSDTAYLQYPGYKLEYNFMHHAGVAVFVREDLSFGTDRLIEHTQLAIDVMLSRF